MIQINKTKLFLLIVILLQSITGYGQNTNIIFDSTSPVNEHPKQIVILNSYGIGLPIPDETKQGIYIALKAGGISMNDIFFEDLDLVRSSSREHRFNLVSLLHHKLEHEQIGIVILIGSSAIEFIANEGKDLFPDAALVALITPTVKALDDDTRKIMYLPWRVDPAGSINLALEVFPDTKHVFVITGAKDGILPFLEEAKNALLPWKNKIDFEYSNEMTYEEMIERTSSLTGESIILYSTFFTDKLSRSFVPAEVVSEVCKKSKVPVFATLEYYMGLGIVGGALLETESLGKQAGNIAIDYLDGKIALTEHVTSFYTPIHYILDWQTLQRFQSHIENIPKDCIIVGKPLTLWEQHKVLVIAVLVIFLILSTSIITLLFWNRRIQKMKTAAIESEARFRVMIEFAPEAVIVIDIETNKIVDANAKAEQLFGSSRQELFKGGPNVFYRLTQPDKLDISESMALYISAVLQGKEALFERAIHSKDGRDLICEVRLVQLPNINTQLVRASFIDITERKQMVLDLINAKQKAEESDRLKSAFLANMSHEIRTPMNGILGFANLLKEPMLTGGQQQQYIDIIQKSGVRMLNIINDIVDISKIESGLSTLDIKETDINEQLDFIKTFFRPEAEAKGLKLFVVSSLPSEYAIINTDREKVYAILTNLVKNAIKYTPKGFIELGYNLVTIEHVQTLQFYAKDTGIGIPNDRHEAIFERFIQADISDKMAWQGAGLGLAITKAYVEMLGGNIWVESQEGRGSIFYFTLPYTHKPLKDNAVMQTVPSEISDKIRNLKILIVEDDEVSGMLIDITVKMISKEILIVRNGGEAVEACRNNPDIDLILMDIKMPVMGGYEATRLIRGFNKDVIIIAQSAFGLTGDREKAIDAGCNDYISKPISKDELLSLIQKYLGINN